MDFFYLLKVLEEENYKLPVINKTTKKEFLERVIVFATSMCNDEELKYETKEDTKVNFKGLFSKNTSASTKHRFKIIKDELMPMLVEEGFIVKVDKKRTFDDRTKLFEQQKGKTTDGVVISPGHIANGKKFHADHVNAHAQGGKTTTDNGKLETVEFNLQKGSK